MVDLANAGGPVLLRLLDVLQSEVVEHMRVGIVLESAVQVMRHLPLGGVARLLAHATGGGGLFVGLDDHPANLRGLPEFRKNCAAGTTYRSVRTSDGPDLVEVTTGERRPAVGLPGTLAELEAALAAVERGGRRRGSRSHSAGAIMGS